MNSRRGGWFIGRTVRLALGAIVSLAGCSEQEAFNPSNPARGPSELLSGNKEPVTDGNFTGGNDTVPEALETEWNPDVPIACDNACLARCDSMGFENPVNRGLCSALWGPGGSGTPIVAEEACRRLWVDTQGRFPTRQEIQSECIDRPWGDVVSDLLASEEFVRLNRRHWADRLNYDTEAVSVERIFDMDAIVRALYEGRLAYDEFAALVSAHPVLTRRHDTSGDRAEAIFWLLLGRPPFGEERADLGKLYTLWDNNYYDHPQLGMRLPDAYIRYRCVDDRGREDPNTVGQCTSTIFGVEKLVLTPDARAQRGEREERLMWSGLLTANEWEKLQAPGRLLAQEWPFWEHAAATVVRQYLEYDLTTQVPQVSEELVRYILDNKGDIRSLHFAVLTSAAYLQSSTGNRDTKLRYTYGPLKQIDAEAWVDSLANMTGSKLDRCDLRINRPNDFLESGSPFAFALIDDSEWSLNDDGEVRGSYRDLVRNLGGCPDNSQGGRFKIVSVLTTANQLNHATRICDPALDGGDRNNVRAPIDQLLPKDVSPNTAVTAEVAQAIVAHQTSTFFSRGLTGAERTAAQQRGEQCALGGCSAEEFARPACFALLSSAEMLFY